MMRLRRLWKPFWKDIAEACVATGMRTQEEVDEMINFCNQGKVDKATFLGDILRNDLEGNWQTSTLHSDLEVEEG